nr:hypothetical protein GCM10017611_01960 [Rhodococcus wratislaviensis]
MGIGNYIRSRHARVHRDMDAPQGAKAGEEIDESIRGGDIGGKFVEPSPQGSARSLHNSGQHVIFGRKIPIHRAALDAGLPRDLSHGDGVKCTIDEESLRYVEQC